MSDIKYSVLTNTVNTVQFKINYLKSNKIIDSYNITWFAVFKTKNSLERVIDDVAYLNIPESESEFNSVVRSVKNLAFKLFPKIVELQPNFNDNNINSWYRNKTINEKIGGVVNSDHLNGEGIDIDFPDKINRDIFFTIYNNVTFKQLIWEEGTNDCPDWVHVAISINNSKNTSKDYKSLPNKNTLPRIFEKRTIGFTNKRNLKLKYPFNQSEDETIKSIIYRTIINSSYYKSLDINNRKIYLQCIFTYFDIRFINFGFDFISTKNDDKVIESGISSFNKDILKRFFKDYIKKPPLLNLLNKYVVDNPNLELRLNRNFFRETLQTNYSEDNKPDSDDLIRNNSSSSQNNNLTAFIDAITTGINVNRDGVYLQILFLVEYIFSDMFIIFNNEYQLKDPITFSYITDLYMDKGLFDLNILRNNLETYEQLNSKNININYFDGSWLNYHNEKNKGKYSTYIYDTYLRLILNNFKVNDLLDIPYSPNNTSIFQ